MPAPRKPMIALLLAFMASPLIAEEDGDSAGLPEVWKWLLSDGLSVLLIITFGVVVWLVLKNLLNHLFKRTNMVPIFAGFVQRGVRWGMMLIITLAVIQQIGVEIGILWGMLSAGVAMVAIGFVAVWSILSNTTAAFVLLMARPFRIGDLVEVTEATGGASLKGTLIDVSLVYTTIEERCDDGTLQQVRIPNNVLMQKTIRVIPAIDGVDIGKHLSQEMMQPQPEKRVDPDKLDQGSAPPPSGD